MLQCPCEECISLAICYQRDVIYCEDLYKFVCRIKYDSFNGYRQGAGTVVHTLYNKWIKNTDYDERKIQLSTTKYQFRSDFLNE
jgi:hypothetical protein